MVDGDDIVKGTVVVDRCAVVIEGVAVVAVTEANVEVIAGVVR